MSRLFSVAVTGAAAGLAACFSTPVFRGDNPPSDAHTDGRTGDGTDTGTDSLQPDDNSSGSCTSIGFTAGADCGSWASEGSSGSGADVSQSGGLLLLVAGNGSGTSFASCTSPTLYVESVTFDVQDVYTSASPLAETFLGVQNQNGRIGVRFYDTGAGATFVAQCPGGGVSAPVPLSSLKPAIVQIRHAIGTTVEVRAGSSLSSLNVYGSCAGTGIIAAGTVSAITTRGSGGSLPPVPTSLAAVAICTP